MNKEPEVEFNGWIWGLIAALLIACTGNYLIYKELSDCQTAVKYDPTLGIYDAQLDAYCEKGWGPIPPVEYKVPGSGVIYITSCYEASRLGIITPSVKHGQGN